MTCPDCAAKDRELSLSRAELAEARKLLAGECSGEADCLGVSNEPDEWCRACQHAWAIREAGRLEASLAAAERERDAAKKKLETCPTCGGDGLMDVVVDVLPPDEREVLAAETCGECKGTGISSWGQAIRDAETAERRGTALAGALARLNAAVCGIPWFHCGSPTPLCIGCNSSGDCPPNCSARELSAASMAAHDALSAPEAPEATKDCCEGGHDD